MTLFPTDIIFDIKEEGWTYFIGDTEYIKENAPEKYKKAWREWQTALDESTKFNIR